MERRWAILPALIAVTVAAPGSAPTAHAHTVARTLEAAFSRESYTPGSTAQLHLDSGTQLIALQLFRSGPESGSTRARDVMRGVAVDRRRWVGTRPPGSSFAIHIGNWPSGLYFARLTAKDGAIAFAPFVLRPRRLGEHRVAVVLPTQTWQAYNFRDDDGDGRPDTWYAGNGDTARLARPFLDRGVPPHFRHYDLPFLHWISRTGKAVDVLSDAELNSVPSGRALANAYDLVIFEGHHEYVTDHEYQVVRKYRDAGGNLMFLFANDFFWRIVIHGNSMTRTKTWRDLGKPEASLIGVQYRANDRGLQKGRVDSGGHLGDAVAPERHRPPYRFAHRAWRDRDRQACTPVAARAARARTDSEPVRAWPDSTDDLLSDAGGRQGLRGRGIRPGRVDLRAG